MDAHAAVPARRRHGGRSPAPYRDGSTDQVRTARGHERHGAASWAVPVAAGTAYGAYAWFLARDERFTTEAAVVGLVAGAVVAVICFALARLRKALVREVRAAAYGALLGCGIGYLNSLTGPSVLWSSVLGLGIAAGVTPSAFYFIYMHED